MVNDEMVSNIHTNGNDVKFVVKKCNNVVFALCLFVIPIASVILAVGGSFLYVRTSSKEIEKLEKKLRGVEDVIKAWNDDTSCLDSEDFKKELEVLYKYKCNFLLLTKICKFLNEGTKNTIEEIDCCLTNLKSSSIKEIVLNIEPEKEAGISGDDMRLLIRIRDLHECNTYVLECIHKLGIELEENDAIILFSAFSHVYYLYLCGMPANACGEEASVRDVINEAKEAFRTGEGTKITNSLRNIGINRCNDIVSKVLGGNVLDMKISNVRARLPKSSHNFDRLSVSDFSDGKIQVDNTYAFYHLLLEMYNRFISDCNKNILFWIKTIGESL